MKSYQHSRLHMFFGQRFPDHITKHKSGSDFYDFHKSERTERMKEGQGECLK